MLVNSKEMLLKARKGKYAIPATDVFNLESLKGVLEAAREVDCPLIVAIAQVHLNTISLEESVSIVQYYASKMKQDIVLHLDHGFDVNVVKQAIDCGFTSVMYDGSSLPFEENIANTKKIVDYAKPLNVTVEAEIGHVGTNKTLCEHDDDTFFTRPMDAYRFVEQTNVDSLAISVGTIHGDYHGLPTIDFNRIMEIKSLIDIPLVLHGGSGSGETNLRRAIEFGISKVNIYTDLINSAKESYRHNINDLTYYDISHLSKNAIKQELVKYYDIFMTKKWKEENENEI